MTRGDLVLIIHLTLLETFVDQKVNFYSGKKPSPMPRAIKMGFMEVININNACRLLSITQLKPRALKDLGHYLYIISFGSNLCCFLGANFTIGHFLFVSIY